MKIRQYFDLIINNSILHFDSFYNCQGIANMLLGLEAVFVLVIAGAAFYKGMH